MDEIVVNIARRRPRIEVVQTVKALLADETSRLGAPQYGDANGALRGGDIVSPVRNQLHELPDGSIEKSFSS